MSFVALECPECGRATTFNGRGRCRCGAYLVHHMGKSFPITTPDRTYVWVGGKPVPFQEWRQANTIRRQR